MEIMNKSERRTVIIALLKKEELSSSEISKRIGVSISKVSPIIVELKKQGKIHSFSPGKFVWGMRSENEQNKFIIKHNEWVDLKKYKLKVFYSNFYAFLIRNENGEEYYENHSTFEFYSDNNILISIDVLWFDNERGKEVETITEVCDKDEEFVIKLECTAISLKKMELKIRYERKELKLTQTEKKEIVEKENENRKQILNSILYSNNEQN
jgi:HSP20 family molecular chaperone IbpA/predicted XRE-type DNA-binding protein